MSGGHFGYLSHKIQDGLSRVGLDGYVVLDYPKTAAAFRRLGDVLAGIEHDLDWWLSGDSGIPQRSDEQMVLDMLLAIIGGTNEIKEESPS